MVWDETEIFYDRSIIKGDMAFHNFKSTDKILIK